ncbi:MAG: TolC family protein [Candidatus Aminicenantes bacterium]|nr:TolC family protein [Candidatus Aminicenantes bacterium]
MKYKICCFTLLVFSLLAVSFSGEKKDFTLEEIISLGLKNNPSLLAKIQEVEAKRAAFRASKLFFNPEIEYNRGRGKLNDTEEKVNTEGFSITQPLENPLKRKYRIKMFEKDWQAAESSLDFSRLEIIWEIKILFFKILLHKGNEELTLKNFNSLKEIHQLILKRAQLGEVRELEAIKLYVETLKAQNELNKVRTGLTLAKEELNKFLGDSLPPDFIILGKLSFKVLPLEEKSLIEKALLSHPLVKKKEKELEGAQSNLSYTKWQRIPDPSISGFTYKEIDGQNTGLGISVEIPLWNFKSKEIAEATSLVLKQEAEQKALRMELRTEIKAKLNQLRLSEQTLKLFQSGLLKEAEESLKIAEVSYKQGEISLIDYLDSQRTYYSILKDYKDSQFDWNVNRASLEKSIGEEIQ